MNVNRVVHTDSRILVWLAGLLLSPIDCRRYYSNYPELAEVIQGMVERGSSVITKALRRNWIAVDLITTE